MNATTTPLAEGKTKILQAGSESDSLKVIFKDTATAFNAQKKAEVPGKGALNAAVSALLFELLESKGLPTCFIRRTERDNELIYRRLTMIPLEVVVRNFAYGSLVKRFGLEEGTPLHKPLVEFFYKSADDPQISEDLILELNLVPTEQVLAAIKRFALQVNEVLTPYFAACGIRCADFKLEFGFDVNGRLILGDELSPDNFRLRDLQTGKVLDKDVFRLDLGDLSEAYQALLARLQNAKPVENDKKKQTYTAEVWVHSRKNILNPESKAILEGIRAMGHEQVVSLNAGKRFVLQVQAASLLEAERELKQLAENVLSNPVIEDAVLHIKP
ncbi:MAG TPA: phosphoribosylaminoimidazolesuccinocarboxamide synthase [Oculatellaceae cyanobacterium]|jgi:phosphoribosylaminoimidazole-succinocarboxamide synthase